MSDGEALYFGCWEPGRLGHYLWKPDGRKADRDRHYAGKLDGRFNNSRAQSVASLHHRAGWTILAMSDYTVDNRGGSNSAFLLPETLSFQDAVARAREAFPTVVSRIEAVKPIELGDTTPGGLTDE